MVQETLHLIGQDKIGAAFVQLQNFVESLGEPGREFTDDLTLLSSRFKRLQRKVGQGIIDHEQADVENNKIRKSLLELANEVRSLE